MWRHYLYAFITGHLLLLFGIIYLWTVVTLIYLLYQIKISWINPFSIDFIWYMQQKIINFNFKETYIVLVDFLQNFYLKAKNNFILNYTYFFDFLKSFFNIKVLEDGSLNIDPDSFYQILNLSCTWTSFKIFYRVLFVFFFILYFFIWLAEFIAGMRRFKWDFLYYLGLNSNLRSIASLHFFTIICTYYQLE